jgi:DNA-binding CsgD family transcriptional regulator
VSEEDGREVPDEPLTEDEKRVLRLAVSGMTNKEVATALDISIEAVRRHLELGFRKLRRKTELDPPPRLPPAAAAAMPVPLQQPEDVPRHVGRPPGGSSSD